MIKKILCTVSVCALAFQSNGMLVESYAEHAYKFSKDTDLIRGYVLSSDGLLKLRDFWGICDISTKQASIMMEIHVALKIVV